MTKILSPLSRDDIREEILVLHSQEIEHRLVIPEGEQQTFTYHYRVHEKATRFRLRMMLVVEQNASLSLDVSSFLAAEQTQSDIRIFLVLKEGSKAVVRQFTHASHATSVVHEEIRGLALGNYRQASFLPELSLLHEEVVATHAASIVRISEKQLRYFLSRGLSPAAAEHCLVEAFLTSTSYGNLS
jgi:Fe-S cluster assembly scaffold protein SufB